MSNITQKAVSWTETGLVPDSVIRAAIRRLLETKRKEIRAEDNEVAAETLNDFVDMMNQSPVALVPDVANSQHYEVPAEFFAAVMGDHLKYSCGYWPEGVEELTQSETAALALVVERAEIDDGMHVLDLGCGWGSLSMWIAERFPNAHVTGVSNSSVQRAFIENRAQAKGIDNLEIITCDMNDFSTDKTFDRVTSIEMFEHMRNYGELFRRIDGWLKPNGKFFMHIFCHRSTPYEYIDKGPGDWMSRYFFTGGIMPSADLPLRFANDLQIARRWHLNGRHYSHTCDAWLETMDSRKSEIMPVLATCYGEDQAPLWWQRWRMFFMACSELFNYDNGNEWYVGHYLLNKNEAR